MGQEATGVKRLLRWVTCSTLPAAANATALCKGVPRTILHTLSCMHTHAKNKKAERTCGEESDNAEYSLGEAGEVGLEGGLGAWLRGLGVVCWTPVCLCCVLRK